MYTITPFHLRKTAINNLALPGPFIDYMLLIYISIKRWTEVYILRNQRLTSPSPRTEKDRDGQLLDKSRWTVEMRRRRQAAAATIGPRSSELKFFSLARFSHVLSVLEVCRWCHSILSRAKTKLKIIAGLKQCECSDLQDIRIDL